MPDINPENKLTPNLDSPDAAQPEQLPAPDQTEDEGTKVRVLPPRFRPTKSEQAPEANQDVKPSKPSETKKEAPIVPEPVNQKSIKEVSALKESLKDSFQRVAMGLSGMNIEYLDLAFKSEVDSAYSEMQKSFFRLTGENLDRKVKSEAYAEVRGAGGKVMNRKEFFSPKNVAEEEKEETKRRIGAGVRVSWNNLPEEERKKRIAESGDIKNASKKYARELELKRQELKKKGIDFPVDVYYDILAQGAEPQKTKKKLFGYIVVSYSKEKDEKIAPKVFFLGGKKDFKNEMDEKKYDIMMSIRESVKLKMKEMHDKGKQAWMDRKIRKIDAIAGGVFSDKKIERPSGPESRASFVEANMDTEVENRLDLLSDEELTESRAKAEEEFKERVSNFEKFIEENCGPICLEAGLTQEQANKFKQAAKRGEEMPELSEKLKLFLHDFLKKREAIHQSHRDFIGPIERIKANRAQIMEEKKLTEARERLKAI